jgi:hypothetical protein
MTSLLRSLHLLMFSHFICLGAHGQIVQVGNDLDGQASVNFFGSSAAISADGQIIAVGAPFNSNNGTNSGNVRVFQWLSGTWQQMGNDMNGESSGDQFGGSVAISKDGSILAAGSRFNNLDTGHVRIYEFTPSGWVQMGNDIEGSNSGEQFGYSLAISDSGSRVVIGTPWKRINGNRTGQAVVYELQNGIWTILGNTIFGLDSVQNFGHSVSISGNGSRIAAGSPNYSDSASLNKGCVDVFDFINGTWTASVSKILGATQGDEFGTSVMLSSNGDRIIIGAPKNSGSAVLAGHARVFEFSNGVVSQLGVDLQGENAVDFFGKSVCISNDGNFVAVGAIYNDGGGFDAGHVRCFKLNQGNWIQLGSDIDGEATNDFSGTAIQYSKKGNYLIVGANHNDGNGPESGHVRVLNICYDSITSPTDFSSYLNPGWATFNVFCSDSLANYQWQMNDGTGWVDLSNAGQFIGVDTDVLELTGVNLSMNNYLFRCIVSHCRVDTTNSAKLSVINGMEIHLDAAVQKIKWTPNPSSGIFHLNHSGTDLIKEVQVFDLLGRLVEHISCTQTSFCMLDLTNHPNGTYRIHVTHQNGFDDLYVVIQ